MVSEVVANVHLGNLPEFGELLVHLLEEIFELLSVGVGVGVEYKTAWSPNYKLPTTMLVGSQAHERIHHVFTATSAGTHIWN